MIKTYPLTHLFQKKVNIKKKDDLRSKSDLRIKLLTQQAIIDFFFIIILNFSSFRYFKCSNLLKNKTRRENIFAFYLIKKKN
jgi:hypothetical protein